MSFDYNTVINTCEYSFSGAIVAGIFGFLIGKVLESQSNAKNLKKLNKKEN